MSEANSFRPSRKDALEERKRGEKERLDRMLIEGLESGDAIRADDEYWEQLRKRAEQRARNGTK